MTDFPTLLDTSTSEIPTLSYTFHITISGGASPYRPLLGVLHLASLVPFLGSFILNTGLDIQQSSKQGGSKLWIQAIINVE